MINRKIPFAIYLLLLIFFKGTISSGAPTDTLKIFYGINKYVPTETHKKELDSLINSIDKLRPVTISGYADNLGSAPLNQRLSLQRAQAVSTYLSGMDNSFSLLTVGDGQKISVTDSKVYGNPQNRRVEIIFTKKKAYAASVKKVKRPAKDGFITPANTADSIDFKKKTDSLTIMDVGGRLSIDELTFEPGRHFLDSASTLYLKILTQYFVGHKTLIFELRGHVCCYTEKTDSWDPDAQNYHLSLNRAKEVYSYFVNNGIDAGRMTCTGVGGSEPKVSPEVTPHDQQLNRRVEIIILKK